MSQENVRVVISATDTTKPAFASASTGLKGMGASAKGLAKSLIGPLGLVAGIAALTVGISKGIKATADFEQQLSDISTLISGDSTKAIDQFRDGIHDLMKEIPVSGEELGASAYGIVSAGITDTSEALEVLKQSARLAVGGLGTTEEATKLLTTALNAFGIDSKDAEKTAGILFNTVKQGITTVAKLSRAFGKMAGNASAAGIGLEDVQAATAAITTVTGQTSEAQNALAQVFLELTQSGGKLDKTLIEQGSSLKKLNDAIGEGGLVSGFEKIRDELGLTDTQFKNMFSSAEGGTSVFQLLTSANEAYINTLESGKTSVAALEEGVRKQTETFNNQWKLLKGNVNVAFQELAIKILPHLISAMDFATKAGEVFGIIYDGVTEGLAKMIITIDKAVRKIKQLIQLAKDFGGGLVSGVGQGAKNLIGAVGTVFGFAEGGVVPGPVGAPVPAIVHGGETVIPAGQKMGGAVVNVYNPVLLDDNMVEKLSDKLGKLLRNDLRV